MDQTAISAALAERKWKGYNYDELQFRALVARTKLELGKAAAAGQYQQMTSSDNAGSQMVTRVEDYMRYASYGMKAYHIGKRIWDKLKSRT